MSIAEIQNSISTLSERDKAKLALWLLDALPPSSEEDASEESDAEAARRRDELNEGRVSPLSSQEFWAGIDRERKRWR